MYPNGNPLDGVTPVGSRLAPSAGNPLARGLMAVTAIVVAMILAILPAHSALAADVTPPDSAAYLLVLDHSGSMRTKTATGKTRWEDMQDRAQAFIKLLPLETRVWLAVFDGDVQRVKPQLFTLSQETDRRSLLDHIAKGYGPPRRRHRIVRHLVAGLR